MNSTPTNSSCPACGAQIAPESQFCSQCGRPAGPARGPGAVTRTKWYHSVWFVLIALTPFVLGPLGLPLLWKSPKFSRLAKLVLTLVTLAWTVWLVQYVIHDVIPAVMKEADRLNAVFQP